MRKSLLLAIAAFALSLPSQPASFYPTRLDDPQAVYLTPEQFFVHADGRSDDSQALQDAIDKVQQTTGEGILFVPQGRYRITRTIYVWPGIRIIGYGTNRPVFVLAGNTPGFQRGIGYLFFYAGFRPASMGAPEGRRLTTNFHPATWSQGTVPPNHTVPDANPGTFYSAMSNVDFDIENGNPAAVAIRFHVAQHGYLAHIDFHIGSGLAALNDSDTITLGADTVLIGLHPDQTQFDILDSTPAFQGIGTPVPLLATPPGGHNLVTGVGLFTGGINDRAVAALWRAGADSLMDDVRFLGGHGTNGLNGKRINPYNANHTADPDPHRRWDAQYPSLWITENGGGTFANIWTPDTFAQAGLYISRTATPGHVYELSSEHHARNEIKLDRVSNWELYALQTEEESGESPFALSLEIDNSSNLTIANYHGYRVVRSYQPFPTAITISHSQDVRFRNVHVDSNSAIIQCGAEGLCRQYVRSSKVSYANSILDQTRHLEVRDREFAWLNVPGNAPSVQSHRFSPVLESGARVEKLATGFFNISGGAVDASGQLYFVDARRQRIYEWQPEARSLTVVRDNPLDPVNLVFDKAGDLIVVSSGGEGETVYSFQPGSPETQLSILEPERAADRPGLTAVLPSSYWVNGDFTNTFSPETYQYVSLEEMFTKVVSNRKPYQYISPDHTTFIPANEVLIQGEPYYGSKFSYILQAFGLVKAGPGHTFYVTNESDQKTYAGQINSDGTLSHLELFVNQGGENLTQDREGNVYLAAGQIFVYNRSGKLIDTIEAPERPNQLIFGGKDRRTLFIFSSSTLYAVRTRVAGY